jgi:branched-chain amino acid transport system permease protein
MQLVINGLIIGVLYSAVAMCFVLILKASRIVRDGRTEYTLIGAGTVWWLLTSLALPLWAGMPAALGLMALLAVIVHRINVRRSFASPLITTTMTALGLAIFFHALLDWSLGVTAQSRGTTDLPVVTAFFATEVLDVLGHALTIASLASLCMTVVALAGLAYFFKATKTGVTLRRARGDHPDTVRDDVVLGWTIAAVLSIVAAVLGALIGGTSTAMATVGENALPALIVGGLESSTGAAAGGLIIGLLEGLAHFIDAEYAQAGGLISIAPYYGLLVLMLLKPNGLFNDKQSG